MVHVDTMHSCLHLTSSNHSMLVMVLRYKQSFLNTNIQFNIRHTLTIQAKLLVVQWWYHSYKCIPVTPRHSLTQLVIQLTQQCGASQHPVLDWLVCWQFEWENIVCGVSGSGQYTSPRTRLVQWTHIRSSIFDILLLSCVCVCMCVCRHCQASSGAVGWPGDGDSYLTHRMQPGD